MRRRRRSSRWLAIVVAVAAVSGASFTIYRLRAAGAARTPLVAVDAPPAAHELPPVKVLDNPLRQPLYTGKVLLVMTQTPGEGAPQPAQAGQFQVCEHQIPGP